jgi:hypothetical protein
MEEMFDSNGAYIEEVDGELRYVTADERGRAVVGPRAHSRSRWMGNRRHTRNRPQIDGDTTNLVYAGEEVRGVAQVPTGTQAWLRRQKAKWLNRFYNEEWHKAVQHTGVDLMVWTMGTSVAAVFVKGAYWVVTL